MVDDKKILDFETEHPEIAIAYGGDGTLLDIAYKTSFNKVIFPIRNYGLCEEHKQIFDNFFEQKVDLGLNVTKHSLLKVECQGSEPMVMAASEITFKNDDITKCMRFDLIVDGKIYMENVIGDGVIFATSLGSHGYFKSIARTIFTGNMIGVGFIAPTYGINNLVLEQNATISMRFKRNTTVRFTADTREYASIIAPEGYTITVRKEHDKQLSIVGYGMFCCPKCRRNRNSTMVNDQYLG